MNVEGGVNDLFGDGVLGHRSLFFSRQVAKAQRTQSLPQGRLIPSAA
jgi:hypothetical protein